MDATSARNRYAISAAQLEAGARVPVEVQVETVDPDRGATLTSSADWPDLRWLLAGGAAGSFGAGLAMGDGDGD